VLAKIHALAEVNPMLGLRGCRLGIVHPEISEMQVTRNRIPDYTLNSNA
jgi:pyruvate,orthophosphate dikinase